MFTEENISTNNIEITPPRFRSLKIINTENGILYYFINDGGHAFNLSIKSKNNIKTIIEPRNKNLTKDSGFIKFRIVDNDKFTMIFELSYYDENHNYQKHEYSYSIKNQQFSLTSNYNNLKL